MTTDHDRKNVDNIDCIEAIDKLYAYLDGEIEDSETIDKVEEHLKHCNSCFTRSQLERELTKRMKKAAKKPAPESLQKRLHKLIDDF